MEDIKTAPVQAEGSDSELNPEELEDVQGGIAGGNYAGAEATALKRKAVEQTENWAENNG